MHLQSALFMPPARITASVPQFVLNIGMRFRELLNFQFLLFYFLSLSVDFAPRVLLTESFVIFYTLITELKSEIRTSSYETLTGSLPWRSFGTTDLSRWAQFKTADLLRDEEETNVSMKMTNREVGGVSVVALDGRIVLGDESNALRVKLKSLIAEGKKQIVLNMDNIKYIDSAGLGILVAAHCSAKTQGASLRLCHLGSKFQEVLQITKLLTVFEVCDTEAAAVASFSN
jgi:anti-sigma B factor antagonist